MILSVERVLISQKHMFMGSLVWRCMFLTEITLEREEEWVSKLLK